LPFPPLFSFPLFGLSPLFAHKYTKFVGVERGDITFLPLCRPCGFFGWGVVPFSLFWARYAHLPPFPPSYSPPGGTHLSPFLFSFLRYSFFRHFQHPGPTLPSFFSLSRARLGPCGIVNFFLVSSPPFLAYSQLIHSMTHFHTATGPWTGGGRWPSPLLFPFSFPSDSFKSHLFFFLIFVNNGPAGPISSPFFSLFIYIEAKRRIFSV